MRPTGLSGWVFVEREIYTDLLSWNLIKYN
jgi:hypothetical protein